MYCNKQQSRTFFSLIEIANCHECVQKNYDQEVLICDRKIPIYYIFECKYLEDDLLFNIKILYILKETISADIILWFETYFELINLYPMIELLTTEYRKIAIIVTK